MVKKTVQAVSSINIIFPHQMKIFVTFFCFFIFCILVLLATVDLTPFLSSENSRVKETAVNSDKEGIGTADVNDTPPSRRGGAKVEKSPPDDRDINGSETGLSRITTHQLIVTEKREIEKFGNTTEPEEATLPDSGDSASAPHPQQPGE